MSKRARLFGWLGLLLFMPLGIYAYFYSKKVLKHLKENGGTKEQIKRAKTGKILGILSIISLILGLVLIVFVLAFFELFLVFS
jgi:hypothetical protein